MKYQKNNIVVYTVIFNDYDTLMEPSVTELNIDYVCFTDNPALKSHTWKMIRTKSPDNPALANRRIKILAHEYFKEHDQSVYIDGNIEIKSQIYNFIKNELTRFDFCAYKHPFNQNISEELDGLISVNKIEEEVGRDQLEQYKKQGFPDNLGLTENRIIFRNHCKQDVKKAMEEWWAQLQNHSSRDQMSLMYILWKTELDYLILEDTPQTSDHFVVHPHKPSGLTGFFWPYWIPIRRRIHGTALLRNIQRICRAYQILINQGITTLLLAIGEFLFRTLNSQVLE